MSKFLVLPTNRPERLKPFFEAWKGKGGWDRVIVVEDTSEISLVTQALYGNGIDYLYSWKEIHETLGDNAWIISRQDSAIRCFGFLAAYHLGAEWVLTLDDDCFPTAAAPSSFYARHIEAMRYHERWTTSMGSRSRGLPYNNPGELKNVMANIGLWLGDGDPDAVQSLTETYYQAFGPGNRIIPHNQYVPVCGMNLCVKREALPLFYFPLMGKGQPYRRFDDIWAGVVAKKCFDHLGWSLSVGEPYVDHRRASFTMANLVSEAPGIAANEHFWEYVDAVDLNINMTTPDIYMKDSWSREQYVMCKLGAGLQEQSHLRNDLPFDYMNRLGQAIRIWSSLFHDDMREKFHA